MSKQDFETLIWVGNNDQNKALDIATTVQVALAETGLENFYVINSKQDSKSMIEVMREVSPDFFIKPAKHTYQDLYMEYARRQDDAKSVLEFIGAVSGEEHKQRLVESVLDLLNTGNKPVISITNNNGEPILHMAPIDGEFKDVTKK